MSATLLKRRNGGVAATRAGSARRAVTSACARTCTARRRVRAWSSRARCATSSRRSSTTPPATPLASASTLDASIRGTEGAKSDLARKVGALLAERAKAAGITKVVFDRGGNRYAGRIAALADAAREAGLEF